jgi:hypothetical protein
VQLDAPRKTPPHRWHWLAPIPQNFFVYKILVFGTQSSTMRPSLPASEMCSRADQALLQLLNIVVANERCE